MLHPCALRCETLKLWLNLCFISLTPPSVVPQRVGTVHISVNAKSACIADADGDGLQVRGSTQTLDCSPLTVVVPLQELVVGRTDRVIEVYRVHTAGTDPVRGETIPAEGVTVELVYTTSLPAQVGCRMDCPVLPEWFI